MCLYLADTLVSLSNTGKRYSYALKFIISKET